MDLTTFHELLTPYGQKAVAAATALTPGDNTLLRCIADLQKRFPPLIARAAIDTVLLRRKAKAKFTRADAMYFTRAALEQASSELVARHRAQRFAEFRHVGDICCGIGGDALAIAQHAEVTAIDIDPLRLEMTKENLRVNQCSERARFICGDAAAMDLPQLDAAFFDPDRRADGRRHISIRGYVPSLESIRGRLPSGFPLGVKIAPGIDWSELGGIDAEVEFISLHGELKECALWFGPLRTTGRRATVLPHAAMLWAESPAPSPGFSEPKEFLYDPDPAVVRAGLIPNLARNLDAALIDPEIAFLTSSRLQVTPFARGYRVIEKMPFNLRSLAECLRAHDAGRVTIVKRGSPIDVDVLTRQLKLRGASHRTVVLTRTMGRPIVLICEVAPVDSCLT